jgi:hypothetical protein
MCHVVTQPNKCNNSMSAGSHSHYLIPHQKCKVSYNCVPYKLINYSSLGLKCTLLVVQVQNSNSKGKSNILQMCTLTVYMIQTQRPVSTYTRRRHNQVPARVTAGGMEWQQGVRHARAEEVWAGMGPGGFESGGAGESEQTTATAPYFQKEKIGRDWTRDLSELWLSDTIDHWTIAA